tara:strand:- start:21542 stop:21703 length:162 start_codon:yes stop_codon:yes gene_type:complete
MPYLKQGVMPKKNPKQRGKDIAKYGKKKPWGNSPKPNKPKPKARKPKTTRRSR